MEKLTRPTHLQQRVLGRSNDAVLDPVVSLSDVGRVTSQQVH